VRTAALAALAALAGCAAVGPDYRAPAPALPAAWSESAAATGVARGRREDLSRWWERLNDPVLTDLVAQALRANPDVRIALARLREARARRALAAAQNAPQLQAGAGASATGTSRPRSSAHTYDARFDASWEMDVFGGRRRALEAAEADLQASAASVDAARVSLVAEVARNYVDARAFQARVAVARDNLATQSETLQLTEWRAQAGLVGSLDVEQARANREQTRAQIPALETSLAEARHRLAILLGQPPAALQDRLARAAPIPRVPTGIAVGIPADVLRQRPDVRAAERTLAAETARIGEAEAARYPAFDWSASIGLEAFGLDALTGGGATLTRSLAVAMTAPVFNGGRLQQQVEIQRAVAQRARVNYEAVVLTALEDVENALAAFANSRARRGALAAAVTAARNAALLAHQRYQGGLVDFQTVLDTERSVLTVEDSLAASEADGMQALVQLYKALGGGWTTSAAEGTP
jgi:multidrug efflux system outer membrane protein